MARAFIPINEAGGLNDERLLWQLSLPDYVNSQQIGLDINRIHFWSRLAGLNHLTINGADGDRTSYIPEVSHVDYSGVATLGRMVVKQEATLSESVLSPHSDEANCLFSEYNWGRAQITINTAGLGERLMDNSLANQASVWQVEPWIKLLDQEIRSGLAVAGRQQLMSGLSFWSRVEGVAGAFVLSSEVRGHLGGNSLPAYLAASLIIQTAGGIAAHLIDSPVNAKRWSLFPGYQIDRYLFLKSLTKAQKVLKLINS